MCITDSGKFVNNNNNNLYLSNIPYDNTEVNINNYSTNFTNNGLIVYTNLGDGNPNINNKANARIINNNTIGDEESLIYIKNSGIIYNSKNIGCGRTLTNYETGTIYNGSETITESIILIGSSAEIINQGTIYNYNGNTIRITGSNSPLINSGTIDNSGNIYLYGDFSNDASGVFYNSGILNLYAGNAGSIPMDNSGNIYNYTDASFNIFRNFNTSGTFTNSSTFIIRDDCSFNNYGVFDNSLNSVFTNYSANFYTRATFDNHGSLTNSNTGNIYVKSLSSDKNIYSLLNIQKYGSLTNSGNILLATLSNGDYQNSAIYNYSNSFINYNIIRSLSTCYIYNNGTIYNNTNGTFGNNSYLSFYNGTLDNLTAKFYNYNGTLTTDRGIYNYGTIHNGYNGSQYTAGSTITANTNGLINYSGTIYNYSGNTITSNKNFYNKQNAIIRNLGTLNINNSDYSENSGTIYNSSSTGTLSFNKNYTNFGSIYNSSLGTITISSETTLTSSSGQIINADGTGTCGTATINNNGTIIGTVSSGCPNLIP
jgi:hypothetical protein